MYGAGGDDDSEGLPGTYEIYKAEADALFKNGDYRKAIESYTTALTLRADDRISLVCRSKCHLMLGDTHKALQDAEASLAEDKNYHKGMFQKAEALYNQGDFEMALVFYHRGNRLRPELQDFRLGIQKAQEAIQNCVGTPDRVKLNTTGDLSFFKAQEEKKTRRKGAVPMQRPQTVPRRKRAAQRSAGNEKTIRQMLGELYGDRQYLEKLLRETDTNTATGKKINNLAEEGLFYLDTRTDFWQQVKPMYARKYEARLALNRGKAVKASPHEYIMNELEKIDNMITEQNYEAALKRSQRVMILLDGYTESQLANKMTFKANLHSIQGNAYLEMDDHENAAKQHLKDLCIGEEFEIDDAECRALDNLGRVYARSGSFQKAIDVWERKLPRSKTALESTWLCHELGRCYLELDQTQQAKDYGERSLAAAEEAGEDRWQLHALVLISQAEVKAGRFSSSLATFERAYELSTLLKDTEAQSAINRAIEDVNDKIVAREKEGGEEPEEGASTTRTSEQAGDDSQDLLTAPTTERTADQPSKGTLDDSQPEEEDAKQSEGNKTKTKETTPLTSPRYTEATSDEPAQVTTASDPAETTPRDTTDTEANYSNY
ncbi:tetratricopeptide repeat protein 25 [Elysia marginata]|uniref:Outer dynein arm-docking complex subunit 4 n=1 Tax=Elysia marginata TaxID=1093978 RepID=A0AAV4I6C3_9GAST|nr:tetratricopeptide repeat protein 25 [Elysia marginata]